MEKVKMGRRVHVVEEEPSELELVAAGLQGVLFAFFAFAAGREAFLAASRRRARRAASGEFAKRQEGEP
jgi:hypothetical protein